MDYLEGIVNTIGHLAWPATATGMIVVTRRELRRVISALAERVRDPKSSISLGKEGLEIKASVQATAARLDSLVVQQDQIKSLAMRQLGAATAPATDTAAAGIDAKLRQMADDYMAISLPDYSERVRAKTMAAREMAFYVVSNRVNKDELAQEKHEGLIIALAASIILSSEPGDVERLLKAGRSVKRLHVRYYVLIALTKLLERRLVQASLNDIASLLQAYQRGADDSLRRTISNVASLLEESRSAPR